MTAPPIAGVRIRSTAVRHPVATFLLLAYVFTVAVVLLPAPEAVGGPLENIVGVAVPAFVVTAAIGGRDGVRDLLRRCLRWRIPVHWYAVALVPAISLLVLAPVLYGQDALTALVDNWPRLLTSFLPTFAVMLLLDALPEEAGATGFLFARLQDRHGALRAALLTTMFFWLWHVPSLIRDSRTLAELGGLLALYLVGHLASRFIVGWLYNATGSSVLVGAVFHATFNSTVNKTGLGVAVLDLPQGDVLVIVTGLVVTAAAAIAVATRGRLGRPATSPSS